MEAHRTVVLVPRELQTQPVRRILRTRWKRRAAASNNVLPEKGSKAPKIDHRPTPSKPLSGQLDSPQTQTTSQVNAPMPTPQNTSALSTTTPLEVVSSRPKEKLTEVNTTMPTPQNTSEPATTAHLEIVSPHQKNQLPVSTSFWKLGGCYSTNDVYFSKPPRYWYNCRWHPEMHLWEVSWIWVSKVWPPRSEIRVVFCDDNIYGSFLNLKSWLENMIVEKLTETSGSCNLVGPIDVGLFPTRQVGRSKQTNRRRAG